MEQSYVESLIRRTMRDRSPTAVGHAVGISQLPRDLRAARRQRDMLSFRELELILTRLEGVDLYDLVDAFAHDAGLSLDPRTGKVARLVAELVDQMSEAEQEQALRVVQALPG